LYFKTQEGGAMRIFSGRRVLAVAAVLTAAPMATLAIGGTASAVRFSGGSVTCNQLAGSLQPGIGFGDLSGCTAGITGGSGQIANFTFSGGNVTWGNGTTTNFTGTSKQKGIGCHQSVAKEYVLKGSVTSGTNSSTPVGQAVKIQFCYTAHNFDVHAQAPKTISF
jgi:hypothetical protein